MKPPSIRSTLTMSAIDDRVLGRLRERARESGYEIADGYCENCQAHLTEADVANGACTQCSATIPTDESADEDLWDV